METNTKQTKSKLKSLVSKITSKSKTTKIEKSEFVEEKLPRISGSGRVKDLVMLFEKNLTKLDEERSKAPTVENFVDGGRRGRHSFSGTCPQQFNHQPEAKQQASMKKIIPKAQDTAAGVRTRAKVDFRAAKRPKFEQRLLEDEEPKRGRKEELVPKGEPMPYSDRPSISRRLEKQSKKTEKTILSRSKSSKG